MKKVLVLGIGNRLMKDDGIGVHVVEELGKRNADSEVCYVVGETDVGYCLQQTEEASTVIIVDAAYLGKESGAVYVIPLQKVLQCSLNTTSFHEFDLFRELKIEGKSMEGMLIGIEPYDINYGMQLSDVLQDKFLDIVDKVKNFIPIQGG